MSGIGRVFRILFLNIVILIALFEITIALMLNFPALAGFGPRAFLRNIYLLEYRNIIQLEPEFARYDPYLKYTLRPGVFVFHNPEFKNEFRVNSLGVRDDEAALAAPEVIVAGDSVAMGWGVDQDETFAKLIEKKSGLKVLNAAVSSYSTVQAMRILEKADTSRLKYLIINYLQWKYPENLSYYDLRDGFKSVDRETYERTSAEYNRKKRYFPMKYTINALRCLKHMARNALPPTVSHHSKVSGSGPEAEAKVFLYTLSHASSVDLRDVDVIVLCEKDFVEPLSIVAASGENRSGIKNIIPVAQPEIAGDRAYIIDDHPTAKWHKLAADNIIAILGPAR